MAELSELYATVGAALLADSTLMAMLGGATQVFQELPPSHAVYPCLTIRIVKGMPKVDLTVPGGWNPVWRIIAYGTDNDVLYAIQSRLLNVLEIPRLVTTQLTGAGFKITQMRQVDLFEGPALAMGNAGEQIGTVVSVWNSLALPMA